MHPTGEFDLNTLMASLSIQFALYGAAWLVIALGYKVKRRATVLWGLGWLCGSMSTALVFSGGLGGLLRSNLAQNVLLLLSLILLQKGAERFCDIPWHRWDYIPLLLAQGVIDLLSTQGEASYPLRVTIFTLAITYPLTMTALRIVVWIRDHALIPRAITLVVIAPIGLTLGVFWLRALMALTGTTEGTADFANNSGFDLAATLMFLVMLGALNFSLANLVLGSLIERLRDLSATDQLTDLPNRRVMMRRLTEEHARYLRSGHGYTVMMMDLDFFKKVNDTYGHAVGDQVLQGVAVLLQGSLRTTDTLARVGGEEFLMLMPMTDTDGALAQALRIRDKIAATPLTTDAGEMRVTMSLGVAEAWPSDKEAASVVERSDAALYQAKAHGRNGVEVAERQRLPSSDRGALSR